MSKKKKRERTGEMFYDNKMKKWVIDKAMKDMTCFELDLINKTDLYTNIISDDIDNDEKDEDWEARLDKRQKQLDKKNQKENDEFWDEYYKYLKNPKKYDSKLSKTEKKIMKFFNSRSKKKNKKNKEEKARKKADKSLLDYLIYEQVKQDDMETRLLVEKRTGYSYDSFGKKKKRKNPNKSFFNNSKDDRNYNIEKTELLRSLEEEILERLNSEDMFDKDNLVVEYSDYEENKKKKKKKNKKDVDRMII